MYILTSHGDYAKETLTSCELITGKIQDVVTVSFRDPMGVGDVINEYEKLYSEVGNFDIIADIRNGTPANAAIMFQQKHKKNVRVFAGLSLSLLLTIATGTTIDEAIVQNREALTELNISERVTSSDAVDSSVQQKKAQASGKQNIVNVRLDARLIHGQVATMWTQKLNATRIMVVDDDVVKSNVQKMTLKTAVPRGVHLSILTADGAAKRIMQRKYSGQRVFIIIRNPQMLRKLVDAGVDLPQVNVGNLSMSDGARQVAKSVAVTDSDIELFKYLDQKGVKLYHQMVPNDSKQDFMNLILEGK